MTKKTKRIKLVVQYDGTDFCGWAEQKDVRTVQSTLKECILRVSGEEVELRGASRTDSGAHALGQVCDFLTSRPIQPKKWAEILNRALPEDVRVVSSEEVSENFHSRFYARSRVYVYRLSMQDRVEPMKMRYLHCIGSELDVEKMQKAGSKIIGIHDFRKFGEQTRTIENTAREMLNLKVLKVKNDVKIIMEANAFIRGMARRIAGGLLEVGLKKRNVKEIEELLDMKSNEKIQLPKVLPAKGLTLVKVRYGRKLRDIREEINRFEDE